MFERFVDKMFGLPEAAAPVEVTRDLPATMPDGVTLRADRYRPRGLDRGPVVFVRTPYGKHTPLGRLMGSALARRGLQVVVQDVRGTFASDGEFWPFHQEKDDGLATAKWLRAQPWCDGRLAMAGPSYVGYTQWAIGPYLDPPLEAMCLGVTASDFVSSFYPGGAQAWFSTLSWSSLIGTQEEAPFGGLLPNPVRRKRTERAMSHLPLDTADVASIGKPERFLREIVAHGEPGDDFWAPIDHSAGVAAMTTPTSMVTGWYDLFLPEQLRDFRTLRDAGRRTRITIGPWHHGEFACLKTAIADQASWLAAHLLDDTTQLNQSPVRLYLQGAERWLDFPAWPPPSTPETLYPHGFGGLGRDVRDDRTPDSFTYDPASPTPSVGGPLLGGKPKQRDNRAVEARPDVLVYTGEPLPRDLDVIGEVSATVHVRTDTGHADVFVRLCDVDRRGVSRNVCDGMLRLRPGSPAPDADGIVTASVALSPTGYRFRRGHRLRMQIAGGAFPRFARNLGTGDPSPGAVRSRPCRFEVFHDADRPTRLVVPVLS